MVKLSGFFRTLGAKKINLPNLNNRNASQMKSGMKGTYLLGDMLINKSFERQIENTTNVTACIG